MDIKSILNQSSLFYRVGLIFKQLRDSLQPVRGKNNRLSMTGRIIGLKKSIVGNDNSVLIKNSTLIKCFIQIRGNGNRLIKEEGCHIGKGCSFWLEGNNNTIIIGKNTAMNVFCHLNAQEHDTKIQIGEDCMFSYQITVRTSDSHTMVNKAVPKNCLVVGMPAKIVKENIHWTKADIIK